MIPAALFGPNHSSCSMLKASLIKQMEKNSGVSFYEAEVALARQWIGRGSNADQKTVTLTVPSPTTEGIVVSHKTTPKTETVRLPATTEEAKDIVTKFEHGADSIRGDDDVSDSVAHHALLDRTRLQDEMWLATPEEELNAYVLCFFLSFLFLVVEVGD